MKQNSVPQNHADENLMFHPYSIMMALMLFGLSGLFISLTASYVYTRTVMNVPPIQVPALFLVNTLILIGSSYSMIRAKRCYLADDTKGYQDNLRYTIYLSLLFMAMQTVAWIWLFRNNVNLGTSTTAAYLYVISFVHLAHVVAGLPFLAMFYRAAKKRMIDPVTVLIYFSDPEKRLRLRLLTVYWHFLDILWVYLVVFLIVNAMI